ncbi:unnamed protein product [Laminaria digitata]
MGRRGGVQDFGRCLLLCFQYSAVQCSVVRGSVRCNGGGVRDFGRCFLLFCRHCAIQCSAGRCSAVRYSAVRCNGVSRISGGASFWKQGQGVHLTSVVAL